MELKDLQKNKCFMCLTIEMKGGGRKKDEREQSQHRDKKIQ